MIKLVKLWKEQLQKFVNKLSNYNSNGNSKSNLRKLSYKSNPKKEKFDKTSPKPPQNYGLFHGNSNNFTLKTQRALANKPRPNSRYQKHYEIKSSTTSNKNIQSKFRLHSRSGRNSSLKDHKNSLNENNGTELKSYKRTERLNKNYFTNGTLAGAGNYNSRR